MLITGANGFIGTNLMRMVDAVPLDLVHGEDVCNIEILRAKYVGGPIVHLAAQSGIPQSIENPLSSIQNNLIGAINVLEFAREAGAKVIFASSCSVKNPNNPYAASKLSAENFIRAYHQSYGVEYAILRFTNVYGPYSERKTSVVANMIKTAKFHKKIFVEGGNQKKDFVFVEDVCRHILNLPEKSGIYNVSTGIQTSINDLAHMVCEKIPSEIISQPQRKGEKAFKIRPDLRCATELVIGLNKTLEYFGV